MSPALCPEGMPGQAQDSTPPAGVWNFIYCKKCRGIIWSKVSPRLLGKRTPATVDVLPGLKIVPHLLPPFLAWMAPNPRSRAAGPRLQAPGGRWQPIQPHGAHLHKQFPRRGVELLLVREL